ncbi:ankyrin unc44 [Colletotrichum kahawae]|uniref:Ankyrin unc44 n=1 Tax=Colletotrichum kahawae TaxID=34407 RepID=A0AAE0DAU9_COLKA|nr:ankyrin unc44 [Colletotrichum kahawae]
MGDFQVSLPPELLLLIAQELGSTIMSDSFQKQLAQDGANGSLAEDDSEQNIDPAVRQVTVYLQETPTMSMLRASTVNRYFREKILSIALRWDADSENSTAIYFAASKGHKILLKNALSQPGANPNYTPGGFGNNVLPPVIVAAYMGHLESVDLLLQAGADVDFQSPEQRWHTAPLVESFTTQLQNAMNINRFPLESLLHSAVLAPKNAEEIAELILEKVPPQTQDRHIAGRESKIFAHAVAMDLVALVDPLIARGAQLDRGGSTWHGTCIPLLHHAVSAQMIRKLLQAGASVQTPRIVGLNALHAVCLRQRDCGSAVQELINKGIDVNETTGGGPERATLLAGGTAVSVMLQRTIPQTALNLACQQLNLAHIKILLDNGANPMGTNHSIEDYKSNVHGEYFQVSPLHDLFLPESLHKNPIVGDKAKISEAIRGALKYFFTYNGQTALQRAHRVSNQDKVTRNSHRVGKIDREFWYTMPHRNNLNIVGKYTPVQLFFMQPLVDDASIPEAIWNACDIKDQINSMIEPFAVTPLIALLSHRFDHRVGDLNFYRHRLLRWLLTHGADPNATDAEGFSPLHYAAFWLDKKAIEILLEFGAKPEAEYMPGCPSPLDVILGGVYSKRQRDALQEPITDSLDTAWKTMVRRVDQENEDIYGLGDAILRWDVRNQLPMCALPNFELNPKYAFGSSKPSAHMKAQHLLPELQRRIDERKKTLVDLLLPRMPQLDVAQDPSRFRHHPNPLDYAPTTLDWACATGHSNHVIEKLCLAGYKMGLKVPRASFLYMDLKIIETNWTERWSELLVLYPSAVSANFIRNWR